MPGKNPVSVMYRGPLTSCNYGCTYCPFAKRQESPARLAEDRAALKRFVDWISEQTAHSWRILFTPWGEALVRSWYRRALARLSQLEHVELVAAQTNLSSNLNWLRECDAQKLGFWATFHPSEVERSRFVRRVHQVRDAGVKLSIGMVGLTTLMDEIAALRNELPFDVPLWINAQQPRPRPYSREELDFFASIDPQFPQTSQRQRTLGLPCRSGETSFTVDGEGQIRRCHFVGEVIGRISDANWESCLKPRLCPNRFCDCYLGLSQFEPLQLEATYGGNLLIRIPNKMT